MDNTNEYRIDTLSAALDQVDLVFLIEMLGMRFGKTPHEMLEDPMILEIVEGTQSQGSDFVIRDLERIFDLMIDE